MTNTAAATVANDNREFRERHQAVSLAQKAETLGQLSEAVAYQFNNLMMAVNSCAEVELKRAAPPQKRNLEQVLSNAARATLLIQRLLAFSRRQTPSPQPLHLNSALTEIHDLVQLLFGEDIEVVLSLAPDIRAVKADPVELEQLVLSLALNTRNAMSASGKVTISTELVELDSAFVAASEGFKPGEYVMLSVNSTGRGPAVPKHDSESRGGDQNLKAHLVLTAIRGMVKEAHGLLRVSNTPKNGSSFKVYFPALGQNVQAVRELEAADVSSKSLPVAKTILVVEDDDAVRVPAAEFLKMEGFKVLQAKTGREAIQMEQHRLSLDPLITDIIMPEMSGREVAGKLLEKYPDLKILYMSGNADQVAAPCGVKGSRKSVLQKPFRLNMLKDEIRDLLRD